MSSFDAKEAGLPRKQPNLPLGQIITPYDLLDIQRALLDVSEACELTAPLDNGSRLKIVITIEPDTSDGAVAVEDLKPGYYRVTGSPNGQEFWYIRDYPPEDGRRVAWGLSYWGRAGIPWCWEYRTFGSDLSRLLKTYPTASFYPDHDRRAEFEERDLETGGDAPEKVPFLGIDEPNEDSKGER
jgi:hypothetical protein